MARTDYVDVEIHLFSRDRVRLLCPDHQEYVDGVRLDADLYRRLLEREHAKDPSGYGRLLFETVFPTGSELHRGLYSVLDSSRKERRRLRLRLNIDSGAPAEVHALHWELLEDGKDFEVGRSPETVFSRYVSQPYAVGKTPEKPRMLCVIAAPIDAHRHQLAPIDYDVTRRRLKETLANLRRDLAIEFLDRPVTPEKLRERLRNGGFHLLHIHGHGTIPRQGESALVLEDGEHKVHFTTESALRGILLGLRDLKLVTLVACHGGEPSSKDDHLSGLAGSLVRRHVPAVVAMRRAISMKVGHDFTKFLYRQLATEPCIDAAVNEARHRLYMENPGSVEWSSPVLYMRLRDGLLWSAKKGIRGLPPPPWEKLWRWSISVAPIALVATLLSFSSYRPPLFPQAPWLAAITGFVFFLMMSSNRVTRNRPATPPSRYFGVWILVGAVLLSAGYMLLLRFTTIAPPAGWKTSTRIQIGFYTATWSLTSDALLFLKEEPEMRTPDKLMKSFGATPEEIDLIWRPWTINVAGLALIVLLLKIFLCLGWSCNEIARAWYGQHLVAPFGNRGN